MLSLRQWRFAQELNESNLSRIYQHIMDHECAIITAFRANPFDRSKSVDPTPLPYSSQEHNALSANKLANRDLKAVLLASGFGVTAVDGSFIENYKTTRAIEVREDSLFVANLEDAPDFFGTIIKLGKKFGQDSVLLIPVGGKEVYLYGTNRSEFPGLDQKVKVGEWKGGKEAEFMTRVKNRPFTFETYQGLSRLERMAAKAIQKGLKLD
jgi:hypothetical protein